MSNKGKLIVIDGLDGSGKATQTALLVGRLKKEGIHTQTLDFPRYYDNLLGALIAECLVGEHGDFLSLDPYIASVLYAADRFESRDLIETWLREDNVVILDRYVSSNQIHQAGKLPDAHKRSQFWEWLDTMEHEVFKLPRPDKIIFLDVPPVVSQELVRDKKEKYAKGKKDVTEHNIKYSQQSRKSILNLLESEKNWQVISCVQDGMLLSPELIHERIWTLVRKEL